MPAEFTALKNDILDLLNQYRSPPSDGGGQPQRSANVLPLPPGKRPGTRRSRMLPPAQGTVVAMPRPEDPPAGGPADPWWTPEMISSRIRQRERKLRQQKEFVESRTHNEERPGEPPGESSPARAPRRQKPRVQPPPRRRPAGQPRPPRQRSRRPPVVVARSVSRPRRRPLLEDDPAVIGFVLLVAGVLGF
jgi:hypothetical protein